VAAFAARCAVFLSPMLIAVAVFEALVWKSGDAWPPQKVAHGQHAASGEVLYGCYWFADRFNEYKLAGIKEVRPEILVVGSSRVMQFRSLMFSPMEGRFYNAGGLLHNAFDLPALVEHMARGKLPTPRDLIAGIDPWWLKSTSGRTSWLENPHPIPLASAHVAAMRRLLWQQNFRDLFRSAGRTRTPDLKCLAIGTRARVDNSGFRNDGSRQYPPSRLVQFAEAPRFVDAEVPPVVERIRGKTNQFTLPADVDPRRVEALLEAVQKLRGLGVEVHVLLPPFSSESLDALEQSESLATWWDYYKNELPVLLERAGATVVPVGCPADFGLSDLYMLDGYHPSEVFAARLVVEMAKRASPDSLLKRIDLDRLEERIRRAALPLAFELPGKTKADTP